MTYPELKNISSSVLPDIMRYSNSTTSGFFGIGILIIIWTIIFLNLLFADRNKALSTATLICALLSVPLRMIHVLQDRIMFVCLGLGILSIFWMIFQKEEV